MTGLLEQAFHNHWVGVIKKIKGVKSAMHIKTATTPPKFLFVVSVNFGEGREVIRYRLDKAPSMQMEDEYVFIANDLKKKGHGK